MCAGPAAGFPAWRCGLLKDLLALQALDLRIETLKGREKEIPKQKGKFEIHRKRLAAELEESEQRCKDLALEQRECEGDIEQRQAQVMKYDRQLLSVKKNDEYQALIHEIEMLKKQIGLKEERIIALMVEADEAKAHLAEDKKRIADELAAIASECEKIDAELAEATQERERLEEQRTPMAGAIDPSLLALYTRIRRAKKQGPAVVPLRGDACSGCNMMVTAQAANEILAGDKVLSCRHCGRLLYHDGDSVDLTD